MKKYFLLAGLLFLPALLRAQFSFTTNNDGSLNIVGYVGSGAVTIPASTNGLPITSISTFAFQNLAALTSVAISSNITSIGLCPCISCSSLTAITVDPNNQDYASLGGVLFNKNQTTLVEYPGGLPGGYRIPNGVASLADHSFYNCTKLSSVFLPNSLTSIGSYAFCFCTDLRTVAIPSSVNNVALFAFGYNNSLTGVYFEGNAVPQASYVFSGAYNAIIYNLPGSTGWGTTFDGQPVVLWNPQMAGLGLQTNQFGFSIAGTSNDVLVVEACTNVANPVWSFLRTLTVSNGPVYFSDPQWANYPGRFYRLRSP